MTSARRLLPPLSVLVLAACVAEPPDELGLAHERLAHDGPWDIPADTLAIGDTQHVTYTGAGPWVGESGCTGSLTPGAAALREWLRVAYPQITSIGGYSCRAIVGDSTTMSVHGTGRALDVMIPLHGGLADNDLGDPIGNYLIEHAEEIGIQYLIWDRWSWNASRAPGTKERSYGGTHPHHDHLHVELSVEASRMGTPWFSGPRALPDVECPGLGPDGGVVDQVSDCFAAYGPSQYWRSESGGHDGALLWTNAFRSETPSNWARWHLGVAEPGDYRVEVFAPAPWSVHRATRYTVRHAGVDHALVVDLSGADGWVELGTFRFDGASAEHVSVYDHTDVTVGADQHVPADAVRLTRVGSLPSEPEAPLEPEAPVEPETPPEPTAGPRTLALTEVEVSLEVQPIPGGDPRLDDDALERPYDGEGVLVGTCSAGRVRAASSSRGTVASLSLLALSLLWRRRRARG